MAYVINTETDEVHKEGCPWIRQIKPRNRRTISRLTDKIRRDYSTCGHCKPW